MSNILDYVRFALYAALVFLGILLFQAWDKDHPQQPAGIPTAVTEVPSNQHAPAVPAAAALTQTVSPTAIPQEVQGKIVNIKTDVLDVNIDTRGGDIVDVKLPQYPATQESKTPITLLNDDIKTRYIAESGLLSNTGPDTSQHQALYTVEQTNYELKPGENALLVKLTWQNNGLTVNKIFTFKRNSYEINVSYDVQNHSSQPWQGNLYTQLLRTNVPPPNNSGLMNLATYFGAAVSTPQKPFEKITFKQMQEKPFNSEVQGGWAAMIQHYFISAWIPVKDATVNYYTKVMPNGLYAVGMIGKPVIAAPGTNMTTQSTLYVGPAVADRLEQAAPGLKLTIDYGWFWFISVIIFWMMQKIYDVVGNWGWSIVLVTIVIKILFYQLSAKSYRSMSALKKLQPRIEALKQRFGEDKQKLTQATLELYREQKVNPMSGCLPILIQIPVFIALYWVLVESVELRHAPFIFWIHDLSTRDPYYVLPVLMGISMFFQQRLNPPPPDPLQAKIMMFMPLLFTFLFANFPAGLMIYWVVNNTLSFLQQWYIMRKIEQESR